MESAPDGLVYRTEAIAPETHDSCIARIEHLPLKPVAGPGGNLSIRTRISFGAEWLTNRRKLVERSPMPAWLLEVRDACLTFWQIQNVKTHDVINQCSVQKYPPGAGIGAHTDHPDHFGEEIMGLSLGSECLLRFRHSEERKRYDLKLYPNSIYLTTGAARYDYAHEIPPASIKQTRYSITFRSIADMDSLIGYTYCICGISRRNLRGGIHLRVR